MESGDEFSKSLLKEEEEEMKKEARRKIWIKSTILVARNESTMKTGEIENIRIEEKGDNKKRVKSQQLLKKIRIPEVQKIGIRRRKMKSYAFQIAC